MSQWKDADTRGLRRAALDTDGLLPLIQVAPAQAADVVLAAICVEPRNQHFPFDNGLGIVNRIDMSAALPENGPMLAFFMHAPQEATETLLAIIDHATSGWATSEWAEVSDENIHHFEVTLEGQHTTLQGNSNVMHWHRGDSRVPKPLATALMACESFLYRQLDAGEDVQPLLERLMGSRSVAIWGVLVEVACYVPQLLTGPLSPLVSSAGLLTADRLHKATDHGHLLMAFGEGDRRRLADWNDKQHRKRALRDLAIRAMLEGDLLSELAAARQVWGEDPDQRWRRLISEMDPDNWVEVESAVAGGRQWEYQQSPELAQEAEQAQRELEPQTAWFTAPFRLRQLVEEATDLTGEQATQLYDSFRDLLQSQAPQDAMQEGVLRQADVECGLAAALLICAPDWTFANEHVLSFCRQAVISPLRQAPVEHSYDTSLALTDMSWDGFCASALPVLWQRDPHDSELREAVVALTINRHYATVGRLLRNVAALPPLSTDLQRLEVLALHWARVRAWYSERRHRSEQARYSPDGPSLDELPDVRTPTQAIVQQFIDGTLTPTLPTLQTFIDQTPPGMVNASADARHRLAMSVDLAYLQTAWRHLLKAPDDLNPTDRARRYGVAGQLASVYAATLLTDDDKLGGTPGQEEHAILESLGAMAAVASPVEARPLWQPVLAAGSAADYWVAWLLNSMWRSAWEAEPTPAAFAQIVKEMIAFARGHPAWTGHRAGDLRLAVLGIHRYGHGWEARHRDLVAAVQPEWAELAQGQMTSPYNAREVVRFLSNPAAVDLADQGLDWLAERERENERMDEDLDEEVAELLIVLRQRHPGLFREKPVAGEILAALVGRQQPLAVQLSASLAGGT